MGHPLDNPVWHALTTAQRALAIGGADAVRYPGDVAPFVAIERDAPRAREAAAALAATGEELYFVGVAPGDLRGWTLLGHGSIVQMHWDGRSRLDAGGTDVVELTAADAPAMLELTALAFPGFFRARTIVLGRYVGVRRDGALVAMAGERMRATGVREVSGVCTHPRHAGRGHAATLSRIVVQGIVARGERPFLHVGSRNARARALYERLGFVAERELGLWHVRRE